MSPNKTAYRLIAIHNYELIDEIFETIPELIAKYGETLDITRRRIDCIRKKQLTGITYKRYKHIVVKDIENALTVNKTPPRKKKSVDKSTNTEEMTKHEDIRTPCVQVPQ